MTTPHIFKQFADHVDAAVSALAQKGDLPGGLDLARVTVELPRDPAHGDLSTNVGMVLAKPAAKPPRAIAELVAAELQARHGDLIASFSVDGPGFLNLRLVDAAWHAELKRLLEAGTSYGDSTLGQGKAVNVEYVSANPTGPMHVGHGRGAVVGDALASLLAKAGYEVTREYYINDAGAQVDVLARSTHLRYREALGETITIPDGLYPGDYLKAVGQAIAAQDGDRWVKADESEWLALFRQTAIDAMMLLIRDDLKALGVVHDLFSSERAVVEAGGVDKALATLEAQDLVYTGVLEPPKGKPVDDWEPRPQLLFRSTQFGDDVDRPLKKSDGSWTYFAADIAYHYDKYQRGKPLLVDIWGADHGGYVKRMQAAVTALTRGEGRLEVRLCQLVNLMDDGQPVKMSKRAGNIVTLRDLIDQVGRDVVRFIMLTRKSDATLDFDLAKVVEQSRDNPVYYVQYAHARINSVLRMAATAFPDETLSVGVLGSTNLNFLTDADEIALVRKLAYWPKLVEAAADAQEPHRVAFYLGEVAAAFHGLWNKGTGNVMLRFVRPDDKDITLARLAMVQGVKTVIASGLAVLGVTPVEEMR